MDTRSFQHPASRRLLSLDVFRGLVIIVLASRGFGLYYLESVPFIGSLGRQFVHHGGMGLHFWDLIMPFFLFIAGVAVPFSYLGRSERGEGWGRLFRHALGRFLRLFLLGVLTVSILEGHLAIGFANILAQIGVFGFGAFLVLRLPEKVQLGLSFAVLLGTEALQQVFPIPGFTPVLPADTPVFGTVFRQGRELIGDSAAALATAGMDRMLNANFFVLTLWGSLAGQRLRKHGASARTARWFVLLGVLGVLTGLGLNMAVPFCKTLCSSSYVLFSGGWGFVLLGLLHQIVDVDGRTAWTGIPAVLGMNALFIFVVDDIVGTLLERAIITMTDEPVWELVLLVGVAEALFLAIAALTIILHRRGITIRV